MGTYDMTNGAGQRGNPVFIREPDQEPFCLESAGTQAPGRRHPRKRRKPRRFRILLTIALAGFIFLALTGRLPDWLSWCRTAGMEHGWNLILVNEDFRLPRNWQVELTELSNGECVDRRIYPDLQQMFDDMRAQGVYPTVASGYRTEEKQQQLLEEKIQQLITQGYSKSQAKQEAKRWVAPVGRSEHQTGLAVDINADGQESSGNRVYAWLRDNAWKYGFILRYLAEKEHLTGIAYEPWHYRYVGKEAAGEIYRKGICLEEYIADLNERSA